ncbi:MAG: alanine racemase [Chloroflexota bacterium]
MPASAPIEERLSRAGLPRLRRSTWLEIDLSVLAANAAALRSMLPETARLAVVIKADAYGHGLVAAAHAALAGGAAMLAVATLDEALALREAGFLARIIVLFPVPSDGLEDGLAGDLDLVVADADSLAAILPLAPKGPRIHLAIDTGMSRGGFAPTDAVEAAHQLLAAGLANLAGTWSHLASPELADVSARQAEAFQHALTMLNAAGIGAGVRHFVASGGLLEGVPTYDMARVGISFYGHVPGELTATAKARGAGLRPALTLKARAVSVQTIAAGESVGYGGEWTAGRESRIATLPIGYGDGWQRAYRGAIASARGVDVPLVGRVNTDAIAIDVTDAPGFDASDEVTLISADGAGTSVEQLAQMRGSIVWEVIDDLMPRIARVYLQDGQSFALRQMDGRTVLARSAQLVSRELPR